MLIKNNIKHFKHLSNFTSLKDFNNNIEKHLADIKQEFSTKELIVLKRLVRFSAKVYGVSNISIKKLLKAILKHDNVEVSEATFHRAKRKSIKLGLLEVHSCLRDNKSQSSNLYVFLPYKTTHDTPRKDDKGAEVATSQPSDKVVVTPLNEANNITKTNKKDTRKDNKENLDSSFVSPNVPKELVSIVKSFFNKADEIYSIYSRLQKATIASPETVRDNLEEYISTFKQSIYRLKKGHIRGDFMGYLYVAFSNTCKKIINSRNARGARDSVYFDWTDPANL